MEILVLVQKQMMVNHRDKTSGSRRRLATSLNENISCSNVGGSESMAIITD